MGNTIVNVGREQVIVDRKLGTGGFSQVYLAKTVGEPHKDFAMKVMYYADQADLKRIKQEIDIHKQLCENEYVVPLVESMVAQDAERKVVMLLDYCPTSTIDVLERTYPRPIKEEAVLKMFYQISHAVAFMHSLNPPLCHRDLKVENVLFKNRKFLLTDFGSAVPESKFYYRKKGDCGMIEEDIQKYTTLAYRSPEMINLYDYKPIGRKADVWALGCILYKLCYFVTPFDESPMKIQFCKYEIPNKNFSDKVTQFFDKIFVVDPDDRIDVYAILHILSQELNLPNPYESSAYVEPIPSEQPTPSPKPTENVVNTSPKPPATSSQGLFWDDVPNDIVTQVDETLKDGSTSYQTTSHSSNSSLNTSTTLFSTSSTQSTRSNDLLSFESTFHEQNSNPSQLKTTQSPMIKSSDLFSFDSSPSIQLGTPQPSKSTDLFSFDSGAPNSKSSTATPSKSPSLFDITTSKSTQSPSKSPSLFDVTTSKTIQSPSKSPSLFDMTTSKTTQSKSPSLFDNSTSKMTPSKPADNDIFSKLNVTQKPKQNQQTFWQSSGDTFDFKGDW
ncbi:non-specific serine/threonine protein kinase [Entamoeba marina]